jgi:hypothetical protein
LEVPGDLAARRIEGDRAVRVEVVARAVARIIGWYRIARTPIGEISCRVISAGAKKRAPSGLPRIVIVLPSLAAGFSRRRDRIGLPFEVAGPRIECRHPTAQTAVAAGAPDNDGILKRERCRRELEVGLVEKVLVPHDLAGLLVGGDDTASIACNRDHESAPQSNAAIAALGSFPSKWSAITGDPGGVVISIRQTHKLISYEILDR